MDIAKHLHHEMSEIAKVTDQQLKTKRQGI